MHCVRAVGAVAEEVRAIGGFPAGLVLHSWAGSAEATRQLAAVRGVHFSLSGHTLRLAPRRLAPMLAQASAGPLADETLWGLDRVCAGSDLCQTCPSWRLDAARTLRCSGHTWEPPSQCATCVR